jgi:hypothetical protein
MAVEERSPEEFIKAFRAQLSEVDDVVHVVLNGHLEVEKDLDDVLQIMLFHPEHCWKLRLGFFERVQMARAYSPNAEATDWEIMLALNSVRNEIAHGGKNRSSKTGEPRKSLLGHGLEKFRKEVKGADDKEVIVLASAVCCGFLAYLEESVTELRQAIDDWISNPPLEKP